MTLNELIDKLVEIKNDLHANGFLDVEVVNMDGQSYSITSVEDGCTTIYLEIGE